MRIPPYYHNPNWQRFFAGIVIGAIIGFVFFIFINGVAQERQLLLIAHQKEQIKKLEETNRVLMEDDTKRNNELEKKLTIQSIQVKFDSNQKIKLDGIKQIDLREQIATQLRPLIGNDIESVAQNKALIFNVINNHAFLVEEKIYQVQVRSVTIYSDLEVQVRVEKVTQK